MIIKSKRIRARGQALKRALRHVMDGEDNDAVVLVRGNVADLEDARSDALRFGREYAVRHWILSPDEEISDEQLCYLVALLAVEFGFDPERAVIWRHTKSRAVDTGCDQHYHLCVAEVAPITGGVMSSSHNFARHEKIARRVELAWSHALVPGRHTAAVVAALERENSGDMVAALREIAPLDHPEAFNEAEHQRAKRVGIDLPRLREMVSDALTAAENRADFDVRLASYGLRLRSGDRNDTPIVETVDGIFVGSLARLTRLRKEALSKRIKFNAAECTTAKADHSRSDIRAAGTPVEADGAGIATRDAQPEPAGPHGYADCAVGAGGGRNRAGSREVGKSGSSSGRPRRGEGDQGRSTWLTLTAGCVKHQRELLDLLGQARRSALAPQERAVFDLDDVIERETRAQQFAVLPEPATLVAAHRNVEQTATRLRTLESKVSDILREVAAHQSASIWQRLRRVKDGPNAAATLEARLDNVQRKILTARGNYISATQTLKTEQNRFRSACAQHESAQSARRTQAGKNIVLAQAARTFLGTNPRAARWGAPHLLRIAADIKKARAGWQASHDLDASDDWSLVPVFDIWGKPYLPPP